MTYEIVKTRTNETVDELDSKDELLKLLSSEAWTDDKEKAIDNFIMNNHYDEDMLNCDADEEIYQAWRNRMESKFDEDIVNNWNSYSDTWTSPRGVEPEYEIRATADNGYISYQTFCRLNHKASHGNVDMTDWSWYEMLQDKINFKDDNEIIALIEKTAQDMEEQEEQC